MSHWFHRNPLKSTAKVSFDSKLPCSNTSSRQVASDSTTKRSKLLDILCDPNLSVDIVNEATQQYLSLLRGYINTPEEGTAQSKLRFGMKFKWTQTLSVKGDPPTEQSDFQYELVSILLNIALWYSKHAAKLAATEKVDMESAKEVHKCLRIAAGIFQEVKSNQVEILIEKEKEPAADIDDRVLDAYINQCSAEAQEVTMARAIELEHSPSLIAALAHDTSKMFNTAEIALSTLDSKKVGKWRMYLTFKRECYKSYAFSYNGEDLLKQDKCGEAIASLRESVKFYERAEIAATAYNKTPGAGITVRPDQHLFFRKLGPHVKRTLEKCERENGFIYHQEIPSEIPELELQATFGLAAPEKFEIPELNKLWTAEANKGFDMSLLLKNDATAQKKDEKEAPVEPAKEKPIYQSEKDPNNSSGCVVS